MQAHPPSVRPGGDSSACCGHPARLRPPELKLTRQELEPLASRLGSDVPFFLYRGTALLSGRGEIVTPLPPMPHRWYCALALPRSPACLVYCFTRVSDQLTTPTEGSHARRFIDELKSGSEIDASRPLQTSF